MSATQFSLTGQVFFGVLRVSLHEMWLMNTSSGHKCVQGPSLVGEEGVVVTT